MTRWQTFKRWWSEPDLVDVQQGLIARLTQQLSEERGRSRDLAKVHTAHLFVLRTLQQIADLQPTAGQGVFTTEAEWAKSIARDAIRKYSNVSADSDLRE